LILPGESQESDDYSPDKGKKTPTTESEEMLKKKNECREWGLKSFMPFLLHRY
jgi:hypothetical protein